MIADDPPDDRAGGPPDSATDLDALGDEFSADLPESAERSDVRFDPDHDRVLGPDVPGDAAMPL